MHQVFKKNQLGPELELLQQSRLVKEFDWRQAEEHLEKNPLDLDMRIKLLGFYLSLMTVPSRKNDNYRKHILWIVKKMPESALAADCTSTILPEDDPILFDDLIPLWEEIARVNSENFDILYNAGHFMSSNAFFAKAIFYLKAAKQLNPAESIIGPQLEYLEDYLNPNGMWRADI